jgi:RHS repeat-associated protein
VTYEGEWAGVNETYTVDATGVQDNLVLNSPDAASSFEFDVTGGATLVTGAGGSVEIVKAGRALAAIPPVTVSTRDGSVDPAKAGAVMSVAGGTGTGSNDLKMSISRSWLEGLPASAFPVTFDPTALYAGLESNSPETYSVDQSGQTMNYCQNEYCTSQIQVGRDDAGHLWRTEVYLPWGAYLDQTPKWDPVSADLSLSNQPGSASVTEPVSLYLDPMGTFEYSESDSGWSEIPNDQPGFGISYPDVLANYATPPDGSIYNTSVDLTSTLTSEFNENLNFSFGFTGDETDGGDTLEVLTNGIELDMLLAQAPVSSSLTAPTQNAVLSTTTPTLDATTVNDSNETDGNANTVEYNFEISDDPNTSGGGSVVESGWQTSTQWSVPAGSLVDGNTYYAWVSTDVYTNVTSPRTPGNVVTFQVKLRKGAGGPSPTDTVGSTPTGTTTAADGSPSPGLLPASETVNLVTGNLAVSVGTHQEKTLSGSAGVSLSYNSLDAGGYGLTGQYYTDPDKDHDFSSSDLLVGQRVDPSIDFTGGLNQIGGLNGQPPLVRWTGTLDVPSSGDWEFGGQSGGGIRVCFDQTASNCDDTTAAADGVDAWSSGSAAGPNPTYGSEIENLAAGQYPITVEAWDYTYGGATTALWMKNVTKPDPSQQPSYLVPSNWLSVNPEPLPVGWSLSEDGMSAAWTAALDEGNQVVLEATDGSTADFTNGGYGGFTAPPGNDDLLQRNSSGLLQLTDSSGDVYTFNGDGTLQSLVSGANALAPASLQYTYSGTPLQLTGITDPVSGRSITLAYGDGTDCPADLLCTITYWDGTTTTFSYTSPGSDGSGVIAPEELTEVDNPGSEIVEMSYDGAGRLTTIQDPLASAAITASSVTGDTAGATTETQINYLDPATDCTPGNFLPACAQVASITQPSPTPGAEQPGRYYCYSDSPASSSFPSCDPTTDTTTVSIAGFDPSSEYAEKSTYNSSGEITSETGPTGNTSSTVWDDDEQPLVSITSAGEQTSTVYDVSGNVTDTYGPAPTACFDPSTWPSTVSPTPTTGYLPVSEPVDTTGCGVTVPHTHTGYDQGFNGLEASYWDGNTQSGQACQRVTSTITTLVEDWGTSVPTCAAASGEFNLSMTGLIDLPEAGEWTFDGISDNASTVTIDGSSANFDGADWEGPGNPTLWTIDVTTPGWQPITVFYQSTSHGPPAEGSPDYTNGFSLSYAPPGANLNTSLVPVPDTALDPNYGLPTSTIDPDGKQTITLYSDPAGGIDPIYGLVTETIADPSTTTVAADGFPATVSEPGGQTVTLGDTSTSPAPLQLTTTTDYEDPADGGYLQKTASVLPAGNETQYEYYGGTDGPIAAVCGVSSDTPQGGQLEEQIDPASGSGTQRVQEFVYDAAGQQVGRRVGQAGSIDSVSWQCTTYETDGSGRIAEQSWPATATAPARTDTYTYGVGGNPLVTSVTDTVGTTATTITSTVDLLGRVVSYTDASGITTTTSYDQDGDMASVDGPQGDLTYGYDDNSGLETTVTDGTTLLATAGYDTYGRLSNVTYQDDTTLNVGYDADGNETCSMFTQTSTGEIVAGDQVAYSPGGRITNELESNSLANATDTACDQSIAGATGLLDYGYDNAGRLIEADMPGESAEYDYTPDAYNDANCTNPGEGANTNRDSVVVTDTATDDTTTTDYCYNQSDQLTQTTVDDGTADTSYTYDDDGNQTTDGATTLDWDASDRLSSTTTGSSTTTYTYDAVDRVLSLSTNSDTTRYFYSGMSTTPAGILNASGTVKDAFVTLPGGVTAEVRPTGVTGSLWSYPNLQGDDTATTGETGYAIGAIATYDPWGNIVDAGGAISNISGSEQDLGAFGADGKLTDFTTNITIMGARAYNSAEGRFLSVDPIDGGCANSYVYGTGDPLDSSDLSGQGKCSHTTDLQLGEDTLGIIAGLTAAVAGGAALLATTGTEALVYGIIATASGSVSGALDYKACVEKREASACFGLTLGAVGVATGAPGAVVEPEEDSGLDAALKALGAFSESVGVAGAVSDVITGIGGVVCEISNAVNSLENEINSIPGLI